MRLLELFSGTGSVKKAVGNQFDEIISIDLLQKFNPTICIDILQWDYKQYPPEYFDCIWASPPCTEYSKAKTQGIRNLELADSIVLKTLEIIHYFKPVKWFIENPATGLLKDREFMFGIPFYDVDYCKFGYLYRKRTRIWTNVEYHDVLCKKDCNSFINGSHLGSCGNGYTSDVKTASKYSGKKRTTQLFLKEDKYSIPTNLIQQLFSCVI